MTGSSLRVNSNCFFVLGDESSPTSGSFSLGALDDHLVFGILKVIVSANQKIKKLLGYVCRAILDNDVYLK
jgi:hypothetical protein